MKLLKRKEKTAAECKSCNVNY